MVKLLKNLFIWKKTADSGNVQAISMYSKYLMAQNEYEEAALYMKIDKRDDSEVFLSYAKMLHDGNGLEIDKKEAAHYI